MRRKGRGSSSSGGSTPLLLWLLALRVSASALTEKTTNDTAAGKRVEEARGAKTIALEVSRKVDPYIVWNTTLATGSPEARNASRLATAGTSVKATVANPRSGPRHPPASNKYPIVHYAEKQQLQLPQPQPSPSSPPPPPYEKRKTYTTTEDYEHRQDYNQQVHSYGTDYYTADNQEYNLSQNQNHEYEDSYNTIPEDQSHSGYDGAITDPWRVTYVPQDPGYFGPPIIAGDPAVKEPPPPPPPPAGVISVRECNCPEIRTYQSCDNPSNNFLSILWALGQNLWDLGQLIFTSSLPFLIPLLVLKMIIVPLKILKFIKLIKLFVKFFIILPFFMRFVYPALTNSFDLHGFLFQKIQNSMPSNSHHGHVHPHNAQSRDDANASSSSSAEYQLDPTAMWDLRACPSRVSCELGSFLASSVNNHFPNNLVSYLKKRADRAEGRNLESEEGGEEEEEEDDDDEDKKNDRMQKSEAFKAFMIALGKRWTQEQCEVYSCAVLF